MRVSACVLVLTLAVALVADEGHRHHASGVGELGKVTFPTSCTRDLQPDFERAVAMLHSFWYQEAEAAFRTIAEKDPDCAIAYWGVGMSLHHPLWAPASPAEVERGAAALEKAKAANKATPRERAYIEALSSVYDSAKASLAARNQAFAQSMEKVYKSYPDDVEAAIFYALALRSTADPTDKTYAVQRRVGAIIDPLFEKQPDHPGLAHYVIHNYDYPELAQRGLNAARRYAQIAPAAPHALHMPSHIFIRLGLWEDAIRSNIDSANAARAHFKKNGSKADLGEQLHAMDYLAYAYLQRGEVGKATSVWEELKTIKDADWSNFAAYHSATAIPARVTLETRRWADARNLPEPTYSGGSFWTLVANGHVYWARALGSARTGVPQQAHREIARLTELREKLASAGQKDGVAMVEILVLSARGWTAFAERKREEAVQLLRAAADLEDATDKHPVTPGAILPAREQFADMLAELGRHREALAAYEASLKVAPNRFNSLRGAAQAASAAGNSEQAARYAATLKQVAPNADPELLRKTSAAVAAK